MIKSFDEGSYYSFPINLNTFEEITGKAATESDFQSWLERKRWHIESPKNSEEVILAQVGSELYEKFFEGYTLKHWGRHPRELDASVCGRIPIRLNRDNRYLKEDFQALPKYGYTALFENILASCGAGCELALNTSFEEVREKVAYRKLVYSGAIDSFYGYRLGHLPYRSLRFEAETYGGEALAARATISGKEGYWQPTVQVNYPNENEYTRIVEMKHATGQVSEYTTIVKEYPLDYEEGRERFYPVPAPDAAAIYAKYSKLAALESEIVFIGRLAKYRYYNMDQIVGMSLAAADKEFKQ
jgi:UDP-galactopyranose mutase